MSGADESYENEGELADAPSEVESSYEPEAMAGEASAPQEAQDDAGDRLEENQGLLRDVAAPVGVELARVRLNTQQLIRLKKGQILRLDRGPDDRVDLVANGKCFARGELVEVDGELGIRLTQVTGT